MDIDFTECEVAAATELVLQSPELLGLILIALGLRRFASKCSVCQAWSEAVAAVRDNDGQWRQLCLKGLGTSCRLRLLPGGVNPNGTGRSWKSLWLQHCRAVQIARERSRGEAFQMVMLELRLTRSLGALRQHVDTPKYMLGFNLAHKEGNHVVFLIEDTIGIELSSATIQNINQGYLRHCSRSMEVEYWSLTETGQLRLGPFRNLGDLKNMRLSMFVLRTRDDKCISLCHDLPPLAFSPDLNLDPYLDSCLEWKVNFSLSSITLQISAFMSRPEVISEELMEQLHEEDSPAPTLDVDLTIYMPKLLGADVAAPFGPREAWGTLGRSEFFGLLESADLRWV